MTFVERATIAASLALTGLDWTGAAAARGGVPDAHPAIAVDRLDIGAPADPYPGIAWATRELAPAADPHRLLQAIDTAFTEPQPSTLAETRALLVIHHGALVIERYATGYTPASKFSSHGVASLITAAGVGALVRDGNLTLDAPAPVSAWRKPTDPRGAITTRHLVTMSSGLQWRSSDAVPMRSDEFAMAFGRGRTDMARYAASKRLAYPAGSAFQENTGSSVILNDIVASTLAPDAPAKTRIEAVRKFYRERLFAPLGITSAAMEFDAAGTFAGEVHMTAGDFARIGYLFLRGGVWNAQTLIPPPTLTKFKSDVVDGAIAQGRDGQAILMVPNRSLIIVRLGKSPASAAPAISVFLGDIAGRFPLNGSSAF